MFGLNTHYPLNTAINLVNNFVENPTEIPNLSDLLLCGQFKGGTLSDRKLYFHLYTLTAYYCVRE